MLRYALVVLMGMVAGCASDQRNATLHKVQREVPALVEGPRALAEGTRFAFCFFRDPEPNLYVAVSDDGYTFTEVNGGKPVMTTRDPWIRDPSVARGPGGGFHMVFTGGPQNSIGYASSPDLVRWTKARAIPVMANFPGTKSCWAPEVVWDEEKKHFLIAWSSEIPGKYEETADQAKVNHRIYCTTTKDFRTFTPARLLYDPGFTVIDATFVKHDGKWRMFFKDERDNPSKKQVRMATGESLDGPYGKPTDALTVTRVEAPCAVKVGEDVIVYFDEYRWHRYGAVRSRDLSLWSDVSKHMKFPEGARHGSVLQVPVELAEKLRQTGAIGRAE